MSGKIELKTREGTGLIRCFNCNKSFSAFGTKDTCCPICNKTNLSKVYNYYPEWFLEITGEDNNKITISPSWTQLKQFIKDVKIHEMRVDRYKDRKKDADRWMDTITQAAKELQTELSHFEESNIPEIYKNQKRIK